MCLFFANACNDVRMKFIKYKLPRMASGDTRHGVLVPADVKGI